MRDRWLNPEEMRWAVRHWATTMGLEVSGIRIMPLKKKWCSMSQRGWMTLSSELLDLPKELGEFVIVHELAHQLESKHGRGFRTFLNSYLPDWEERHVRFLGQLCVDGKWEVEELYLSEEDEQILDRVMDSLRERGS